MKINSNFVDFYDFIQYLGNYQQENLYFNRNYAGLEKIKNKRKNEYELDYFIPEVLEENIKKFSSKLNIFNTHCLIYGKKVKFFHLINIEHNNTIKNFIFEYGKKYNLKFLDKYEKKKILGYKHSVNSFLKTKPHEIKLLEDKILKDREKYLSNYSLIMIGQIIAKEPFIFSEHRFMKVIVNPFLAKDYNIISNILNPYEIYQEIENYISNLKCKTIYKDTCNTDKCKIIQHGFDLKKSFRHKT